LRTVFATALTHFTLARDIEPGQPFFSRTEGAAAQAATVQVGNNPDFSPERMRGAASKLHRTGKLGTMFANRTAVSLSRNEKRVRSAWKNDA
jgi:hypothetical protein